MNGLAAFWVGLGADKSGRFVDGDVKLALHLHLAPFDRDFIMDGINVRAEFGYDSSVHQHLAVQDQLFAGAP